MLNHRKCGVAFGWTLAVLIVGGLVHGDDASTPARAPGREIPAAFAPFEYLVGSWKGSGVPSANKIRGWAETHAWAWTFQKGTPVGLALTLQGDKVLARGRLTFDPASKVYTLNGNDPAGKPLVFSGTLDASGKTLTLLRDGTTSTGAKQRLTLKPNANFVRYSVWVDEQEPGAPQFKRAIEVGLTKEGESFAAGSANADLPKCIVTGGAATLTVSYQGRTFPLCCSGCREEFNENPEKYVKKLALIQAGSGKTAAKPASSSSSSTDDGAFDGLTDAPRSKNKAATASPPTSTPASASTPVSKPSSAPRSDARPAVDPASRAASLLRLGQNLEKAKKSTAALPFYRQIVKDYPNTPAAKTAAERVKAIDPPR